MSSKESGQDDEIREELVCYCQAFAMAVSRRCLLLRLHQLIIDMKSPQAQRQTKKHVEGDKSTQVKTKSASLT